MIAGWLRALLAACALIATAGPGWGQGRMALVIANRDYGPDQVATPSANRLAKDLGALGFAVERKEDLTEKELEGELTAFLRRTPTNGTAVVCFSGRGLSRVSGQKRERSVRLQGVGEAKDERSAERAGVDVQRLFPHIEKSCGARRVLLLFEFAENPALKSAAVPTAGHLAELEAPDGVAVRLADSEALAAVRAELGGKPIAVREDPMPGEGKRAGEEWVNGIGMVFCWCPAGRFEMGIPPRDGLVYPDATPVEAEISRGYWMAKFEMTQREYRAIRGKDPNRGLMRQHRNAPATNIGNGAPDLAKKLTELERKEGRLPDGWAYVVPSEAEWEYACRAGSRTRYCFGDRVEDLAEYANFADRTLREEDAMYYYALDGADDGFGATLALTGTYKPNAWGIHDMHGNVSEWCREYYVRELPGGVDPYPSEEVKEGEKVIRGGAWCSLPEYCQSGFRSSSATGNNAERLSFLGVRLALKRVK